MDIKNNIEIVPTSELTDTKHMEAECKNTIGYAEAKNKESFITGAQVALSKAESFYSAQIKHWESVAKGWENSYNSVHRDIKTLASIIERYTPDN